MARLLEHLFRACLLLFVLGGIGIVVTQSVGLVAGSGSLVENVAETLGPPTYALAGIAGLLGFVLAYLKGWDTSD